MKRVLLVTYYWPPSGGSGVQRVLKFCKYLRTFGWEPVVVTVDPRWAAWPDLDASLESDVPIDMDVIKTYSWDPYAVYARFVGIQRERAVGVGFLSRDQVPGLRERVARWVRANIFLPDARVGWVPFAISQAVRSHRERPVHAVVTSGPPHSVQITGYVLQRLLGIPWMADLRDAWPDASYAHELPTLPLVRDAENFLVCSVLGRADRRVTVSHDVASWMTRRTGLSFEILSNGFDPDDMRTPARSLPGFTLVHTGNMGPARNPAPIFRLLARGEPAFAEVRMVLVGNVDAAIRDDASRSGLEDRLELPGYVSHTDAVGYMKGASVLLLPINRVEKAAGIVTGKIFEYVASGRPVLGLGVPGGEADRVLRESGAGRVFAYDDDEGIRSWLRQHVDAWRAGQPLKGATPEEAAAYSRREQTGTLASCLESMVAKS